MNYLPQLQLLFKKVWKEKTSSGLCKHLSAYNNGGAFRTNYGCNCEQTGAGTIQTFSINEASCSSASGRIISIH